MKIPDSITINTGEQRKIYGSIEKFFLETKSEIEKKVGVKNAPAKFRIDIVNLCKLTPATPPLESDEFAHRLYYQERVVAVVFETRTGWNYIHFDYFQNLEGILNK
jgi:hypothetical protein